MTRFVAVTVFLLAIAAAVAAPAQAPVETPASVFEQANALYDGGDFAGAIKLYDQLVAAGVENADLYYNLGNAFYKAGHVGRAVLYYERARRLSPRGEDISDNLSLARALLRDRQFVAESGWLKRVVMWPHEKLNTRETFALTSLWYMLLMLALLGLIFRATPVVGRIYPHLSMLSPGRLLGLDRTQDFILAACTAFLLTAVTGTSAWIKYRAETERSRAVVVEPEVAVYSGPSDDSTLQFKIHEGTTVRIDGERTRWTQVHLPGGLSGWIRRAAVERI